VTKKCPRCGSVMTPPDLNLIMCGACCDAINRQVGRGEILRVWDERPHPPLVGFTITETIGMGVINPAAFSPFCLRVYDEIAV